MTPKEKALRILERTLNENIDNAFSRNIGETMLQALQRDEREHQAAINWLKGMPEFVKLQSTPAARLDELANSLVEIGLCSRQEEGFSENVARLFSKLFIEPKMREACARPLSNIVDHDGGCNILNGADGAGCNCTARERQKMQNRIDELEKKIRWNRQQDWGNESTIYYRKQFEQEFEISKKHLDKIRELEKYIKERSAPIMICTPVELSKEALDQFKQQLVVADMRQDMSIEIVRHGMTIYDMTQLVCGELPENYQIHIHMENGYGEAMLYFPTQEPPYDGSLDGSTLADANIEKQIIELVKLAKGEPSEYDREQP